MHRGPALVRAISKCFMYVTCIVHMQILNIHDEGFTGSGVVIVDIGLKMVNGFWKCMEGESISSNFK